MRYLILMFLNIFCLTALAQSSKDNSAPLTFEKAYLHTDRDVYAQGDTLWFKAYLVNAQGHQLTGSSGNLYVELMAPDSAKIIFREIIRLDNGLGNGDMELTDSLPSGQYRLRAYTNWMRNFGDNFVFEKNITLLNTQAMPPAPVDPKTAAAATKNKAKDKATDKKTATATATSSSSAVNKQPIVRFYPEGGSLVQGISAIVGVKAEDGYGKGIPVAGAVISTPGDTVAIFSCDSLGLGLLALLPVKGQSYHAVVNPVPGGILFRKGLVFELPSALSKGLTLQVRQTDSLIRAVIRRGEDTGPPPGTGYLIVVKHAGKTLLNQSLQLQGAQASANIAAALLPEGISAITLYDEQGKPNCERLVYVHHPGVAGIAMQTDKKVYQPKEKVSVNISSAPNSSLSMAVVDADIVPGQAGDIASYLLLQSEVKGNIENAGRYFDTTNVNRFKQLDLLLLTQGWRDFVWRRMADTAIRISYAAESGINVPGRVWDEVKNKMMPGLNISLYAGGAKGNKLFSAVTDSAGRFHFDGLLLYGKQNIKLASVNDAGKVKGSFMVDTVLPMPAKTHLSRPQGAFNPVDSAAVAAVEKRVETMKTSKIFGVTKLKEVTIKEKKSVTTRGGEVLTSYGPDQIFNITPNDYQYKTLEWFLQQNTKGAVKPVLDPNRLIPPPPNIPSYSDPDVIEEYSREMREFMRPLTGLAYMGQDTFLVKSPGLSRTNYSWRTKSKPIPPNIIVNGRELYMDDYNQAEAYRTTYFNMPMNKIKKVVLRHMTGTLHGGQRLILPVGGQNIISPAQVETIPVDRYLLYLTLDEDAMTDNPGSLNVDVPGYYQARTFYSPPPDAKPSLADYRTTIHWEPNIKTDATGKATVSFYNALPQTNVRVIVQGITGKGGPVASTITYQVK